MIQKKKFDFDNDGVIDQILVFSNSRILSKSFDRNQDGSMDCFFYYDRNKNIYMKEYDTNSDGLIDLREDILSEYKKRKSKDIDHDGSMDIAEILHFDKNDKPSYVEIDWNMDHIIDSKINLLSGLRYDKVNGRWYKTFENQGKRFIFMNQKRLSLIFSHGKWVIQHS